MIVIPKLETPNLIITILQPKNVNLLVDYQIENKKHLFGWEPERSPCYFTAKETSKRVEASLQDFQLGKSLTLVGFNKDKTKIMCVCSFSNITYGVFQACNLGYSVSEKEQGKGLMFEMLNSSISYVSDTYGLHRIMANYMPFNNRSENLLLKLGFKKEGLAISYLKIAGEWQDHVLTSKILD